MKTASLVLGILAFLGMFIALFPCLGAFNWINIPFSVIGLVISIVALVQAPEGTSKSYQITGSVLCSVAIVFGLFRLILGAGVV